MSASIYRVSQRPPPSIDKQVIPFILVSRLNQKAFFFIPSGQVWYESSHVDAATSSFQEPTRLRSDSQHMAAIWSIHQVYNPGSPFWICCRSAIPEAVSHLHVPSRKYSPLSWFRLSPYAFFSIVFRPIEYSIDESQLLQNLQQGVTIVSLSAPKTEQFFCKSIGLKKQIAIACGTISVATKAATHLVNHDTGENDVGLGTSQYESSAKCIRVPLMQATCTTQTLSRSVRHPTETPISPWINESHTEYLVDYITNYSPFIKGRISLTDWTVLVGKSRRMSSALRLASAMSTTQSLHVLEVRLQHHCSMRARLSLDCRGMECQRSYLSRMVSSFGNC